MRGLRSAPEPRRRRMEGSVQEASPSRACPSRDLRSTKARKLGHRRRVGSVCHRTHRPHSGSRRRAGLDRRDAVGCGRDLRSTMTCRQGLGTAARRDTIIAACQPLGRTGLQHAWILGARAPAANGRQCSCQVDRARHLGNGRSAAAIRPPACSAQKPPRRWRCVPCDTRRSSRGSRDTGLARAQSVLSSDAAGGRFGVVLGGAGGWPVHAQRPPRRLSRLAPRRPDHAAGRCASSSSAVIRSTPKPPR